MQLNRFQVKKQISLFVVSVYNTYEKIAWQMIHRQVHVKSHSAISNVILIS